MKLSPHNCARVNIFTFLNFTKSDLYSDAKLDIFLINKKSTLKCMHFGNWRKIYIFLDGGNL